MNQFGRRSWNAAWAILNANGNVVKLNSFNPIRYGWLYQFLSHELCRHKFLRDLIEFDWWPFKGRAWWANLVRHLARDKILEASRRKKKERQSREPITASLTAALMQVASWLVPALHPGLPLQFTDVTRRMLLCRFFAIFLQICSFRLVNDAELFVSWLIVASFQ